MHSDVAGTTWKAGWSASFHGLTSEQAAASWAMHSPEAGCPRRCIQTLLNMQLSSQLIFVSQAGADSKDVCKGAAGGALHSGVVGLCLLSPLSAGTCLSGNAQTREATFPRLCCYTGPLNCMSLLLMLAISFCRQVLLEACDLQANGPKGAAQVLLQGGSRSVCLTQVTADSEQGPCCAAC